jgi:LysM repeat protein
MLWASILLVAQTRHTVVAGETLYGLSKRYQTTIAALEEANPALVNGLKVGMVLTIPSAVQETKVAATPGTRVVKKGETIYRIAKEENLTVDELLAMNPEAKTGLKEGMVLKLKQQPSQRLQQALVAPQPKEQEPETWKLVEIQAGDDLKSLCKTHGIDSASLVAKNPELLEEGIEAGKFILVPEFPQVAADKQPVAPNNAQRGETIKVALLLPIQSSKTDSALQQPSKWSGGPESAVALEFLNGFRLGVDSLARRGMNLEVKAIEFNKGDSKRQWLEDQPDVVFGPFYGSDVTKLAQQAAKSNVLLVSPFARGLDVSGRNLVDLYANPDGYWEALADHIRSLPGRDTILLVSVKADKELPAMKILKSNMGRVYLEHKYDAGALQRMGGTAISIPKHIKHVVLVEEQEVRVSRILMGLHKSAEGRITLYGSPKLAEGRVLDKEMLNDLNFTFPSLFWPDYDAPATQRFVDEYRKQNHAEPTKYAFMGFDAAVCVLLSYQAKGAFWGWNQVPLYRGLGSDIVWRNKRNQGFRMVRIEAFKGMVLQPLATKTFEQWLSSPE